MSPPCQSDSDIPPDSDTPGSDSDTPPDNQGKRSRLLDSTGRNTKKGAAQKGSTKKPAKKPAAKKGPVKKVPVKKSSTKKTKRFGHTMHAVHTYFTGHVCFAVSQLYRLAVYDNSKAGPCAQSKAAKAVLWHELDRPDSTKEERDRYHQYCSPSWCPYQ